jgi:uncharacterized protein
VNSATLLDTGPLVSLLIPGMKYHSWATAEWAQLTPPLLTCEPVLTEATFLLRREGRDAELLFDLLGRGIIRIGLRIDDEQDAIRTLMHRYANRPMSLADACLVRMSEMHRDAQILTFDSDFRVYRRNGNKVIPLLTP